MSKVSELFSTVADWATRRGHKGDGKSILSFDGPTGFSVMLNTSPDRIDGLEGYHMAIYKDDVFPVAVLSPFSGVILDSPMTEDDIISAFSETMQ